jgi:hypothetical protein
MSDTCLLNGKKDAENAAFCWQQKNVTHVFKRCQGMYIGHVNWQKPVKFDLSSTNLGFSS